MTSSEVIGYVLGTQEATPLEFWIAVDSEKVLRLDDVVEVETHRPDNNRKVHFYGVVDYVRTQYEGAQFDTDTLLVAKKGTLPINISYTAHVQVTRIEPEEYLPPQPGDKVYLAVDKQLASALYFESMDTPIPAGIMNNGNAAYFNYSFINGEKGAHVNISGVSGVATKTSYALFLLYSIFNSPVLGSYKANTKALIFNVKGEDLFFLDKLNQIYGDSISDQNKNKYEILKLPIQPFKSTSFRAAPKKDSQTVDSDLEQRSEGISVYLWSLRELCRERLFRFLFTGEDLDRGNLSYLVTTVEERLARLAEENDESDRKRRHKLQAYLEVEAFGEHNKTKIKTFRDLIDFLEDKLLNDEDREENRRWLGRNAPATAEAMIRRLYGISSEVSHLIRGDLSPDEVAKYKLNPLASDAQLTVTDIHKLTARAQKFVVGVLLQKLFFQKEKQGREPVVFIVLDELNKYAPRDGRSPIKDLLVDIAERGRSLGIILIGAQQTASEVERRVVGQAAIRVVGRLDSAEAERPEYNFLTGSCRKRALFLKSGTMFVHQPEVPAPILVNFPFPAYATRKEEVFLSQAEIAIIETDIDRF
ncbi:ATP-binding protein [Umezakia ovalisporum]|jgi:DNA helicase HerA-like ATPase|uniref:ATP-binding protein n=1 Tax=Umezakia ovalisporum FSS-62 TaxID=2971776 RepID=A0AA43KDI2_9CYAN|nr:ATP-binding protein [Umezakia ovalisporum]MBI1241323.1 ATP-binding protein [Nostoc sp. RI_552]MDH6062609.1 ATP-binding protein [Umezakia ovalisporum FSS-62]MDH6066397.1 ATP-binding protein [Umezakia ovalisporum APH033B]MDH6079334.1 ATP-binding protein [Umezakia ovalisporum FSS-45]MDH6084102.1 ATP-binding protein [Umezakia ovalisporum TAC611]